MKIMSVKKILKVLQKHLIFLMQYLIFVIKKTLDFGNPWTDQMNASLFG